jgi:perosamine synthetase
MKIQDKRSPAELAPRDIPLARPNVSQAEIEAVTSVMSTPNLSLGPKAPEFERVMSDYCERAHGVACSSGTAALHMLMIAHGIGPGDEVITTPFSFVASASCILMVGATPVFVDVDPGTWNMDPARIEAAITSKTKGIIAVDVFGQPVEMDPILSIAEKHGLIVIEDSCEALGSTYRGKRCGSFGSASVFGFYPNKQLTTGEGGMIVTDDESLAARCRSLRNQGRDEGAGWLLHARLGYNFRLSDINCAMGIVQLDRMEEIIAERTRVEALYRSELADEPRVQMQAVISDVEMSWFVFVVRLSDAYSPDRRNEILAGLRDRGVQCSNYFAPIHLQPYFVDGFGFGPGDFPICEALSERTIALPFHHLLTKNDTQYVCQELRRLL